MKYLHLILGLALAGGPITACNDDDDGDDDVDTGASGSGGGGAGSSAAGSSGAMAEAGSSGSDSEDPADIIDTAVAAGSFTQLAEALTTTGLVAALKGEGPFTVFAPNDEAFAAFEQANPGVLAGLSEAELTAILEYHVIAGAAVRADDLVDGGAAVTVNGAPVLFDLDDGARINDANITATDVVASNGVIHVIDTLIVPPADDIVATAVAAGNFTSLAAALGDAGLVETLQGEGPFTVFAPTDDAFAELSAVPTGDALENVLLYHVVEGAIGSGNLSAGDVEMLSGQSVAIATSGGVTVNGASVTMADILTRNGIIHVIDAVLVPQ